MYGEECALLLTLEELELEVVDDNTCALPLDALDRR